MITSKNIKHEAPHKISELFYYDIKTARNKTLLKGLIEYQFLLNILDAALFHFETGDLEKFDALVGENACQIRAVKIAMIYLKYPSELLDLRKQIEHLRNKLTNLLETRTLNQLMNSGVNLKALIETHDLDLTLNSETMFIFLSFILTEMKEPQPQNISTLHQNEKSTPKKLKKYSPDISVNFASLLTSKVRRHLANASVQFVTEKAWEIKDTHLIEMVSEEYVKESNTWPCLPMFWTYKILLQSALKEGIPIILRAKFLKKSGEHYKILEERTLIFKPCHTGQNYVLTQSIEKESAACVIQGVVLESDSARPFCIKQWEKNLLKHSVVEIILAGAADHRQYPDDSIQMNFSDPEYKKYIDLAQNIGFSINNPTTFFINHVYPIVLKKNDFSNIPEQSAKVSI